MQARAEADERAAQQAAFEAQQVEEIQALQQQQTALAAEAARLAAEAREVQSWGSMDRVSVGLSLRSQEGNVQLV